MISKFSRIDLLKSENPFLYEKIKNLIKSENFPCLFAINSFHKKQMFVCDVSKSSQIHKDIYEQLNVFHKDISSDKENKRFYTLLIVIPNLINTSPTEIQNFLFDLLINIKAQNPLDDKLSHEKILEKNFEFQINETIWFPVLLCNNHVSKIRNTNTPISIIAFQPKRTFDNLKKCPHNFYEKTRQATHKRIDKVYSFQRPYFLSKKSSGINAIQYLGFDPSHPEE